jgi:RNA polymerase sigma-32 factor
MTTTSLIPIGMNLSTDAGLAAYIRAVNAAPVLTAAEETRLAKRYRKTGDLAAAQQLVLAHLRFVVKVARGFGGYGLPQADLIQEGNIGLMKAVKHYDPKHKVRLLSFAVHWIRAEIFDYVLRNWRIVKVATTKAQRKLFFNLRKSRTHTGWMNQQEIDALASDLDVPVATVKEMEGRLTNPDVPFDAQDEDDDEQFRASPAGTLQDMRYNPERMLTAQTSDESRTAQLSRALDSLDARARDIIRRRWLAEDSKETLHELAAEYKVSAERIRQIEKKALADMKRALGRDTLEA